MGGALHGVLGASSHDALLVLEGIAVFARMLSRCPWAGLCIDIHMSTYIANNMQYDIRFICTFKISESVQGS